MKSTEHSTHYKALVSLWFEHGIYVKDNICDELGMSYGDLAGIEVSSIGSIKRLTIERIRSIDEINPDKEALMLLSIFDHIATHHYYFLAEFNLTSRVSWKPHQYDYILDLPIFEWLRSQSRYYKIFKKVYTMLEEEFIDVTMNLRTKGIEPQTVLMSEDEGNKELKEKLVMLIEATIDKIKPLFEEAINEADIVIGSSTFFSSTYFPIETAFLISGIDIGSHALLHPKRGLTVNPFLAYWLLSNLFQLKGEELTLQLIPTTIIAVDTELIFPLKKLKLKVYNPSKTLVQAFWYNKEAEAKQWIKDKVRDIVNYKNSYLVGDLILLFTSPARVQELTVLGLENAETFVDITPYGEFPCKLFIPVIRPYTDIEIEFFTDPLHNREHPIVLDTNVITSHAYPYSPNSSFFKMYMFNRELIIPATVTYELKRKFKLYKERLGIVKSLARLYEMQEAGYVKLRVIGDLIPEQVIVKDKELRELSRDFRDTAILLEALKSNAILFTNDKELRKLALLLGIASISYNSLLDDVETIIREKRRISKNDLIKIVKEYAKEIRGEEYAKEDIEAALAYLYFSKKIKYYKGDIIEITSS